MNRRMPPEALLAALLVLVATGVAACRDPDRDRAAGLPDEILVVEGSVELVGTSGLELAVDPSAHLVYVAGGMGQTGLVQVDVARPSTMTATAFAPGFGGGVAVDPVTGRVATTDAFGGTLGIFERSGAAFDTVPIQGCGGSLAEGGGRFAVSTQCVDTFAIYDPGSRALVLQVPAGGVAASNIAFHEPSGRFYFNRTPAAGGRNRNQALVATPSGSGYAATDLGIDGFVAGAGADLDVLYLSDEYGLFSPPGSLVVLDGATHAFVAPIVTTVRGTLAVADDRGRLFYSSGDRTLRLIDAASGTVLFALDLPAATGGFSANGYPIATDGKRAYVVATLSGQAPRLFAIGRRRV